MSIEQLLADLKEAVEKNTAALERLSVGGASGSTTSTSTSTAADEPAKRTRKPAADKEPAADKKPEVTQEQMQAALIKIKDDFGMDKAKEVIKEAGGVDKMGDIKPAKYAAVFEAAVAKHAELSGGDEDGGDL